MGGYCPGGYCQGGILTGGYCPRGILSGGILAGDIVRGDIDGRILSCHRRRHIGLTFPRTITRRVMTREILKLSS